MGTSPQENQRGCYESGRSKDEFEKEGTNIEAGRDTGGALDFQGPASPVGFKNGPKNYLKCNLKIREAKGTSIPTEL